MSQLRLTNSDENVVVDDHIRAEEHAWVRPGHWRGSIPRPGEQIRFSAHLEPYWRDDGSYDIGLFRCRRLE